MAKIDQSYHLGPHLFIRLYECSDKKIATDIFLLDLLDNLANKIGSKQIRSCIFCSKDKESKNILGFSAVSLFAGAHIALHVFIPEKTVFLTIMSLQRFEITKITDYLVVFFEASKHELQLLSDGTNFYS